MSIVVIVAVFDPTDASVMVPRWTDLITPGQYSMTSYDVRSASPVIVVRVAVMVVALVSTTVPVDASQRPTAPSPSCDTDNTLLFRSTVLIVAAAVDDPLGIDSTPRWIERIIDRCPNCATRESSAEPVRAFCGPCRMTTG